MKSVFRHCLWVFISSSFEGLIPGIIISASMYGIAYVTDTIPDGFLLLLIFLTCFIGLFVGWCVWFAVWIELKDTKIGGRKMTYEDRVMLDIAYKSMMKEKDDYYNRRGK